MNKNLILLLVIFYLLSGCANSEKNQSSIFISNEASNEIVSGKLKICSNEFYISHLQPKQKAFFNYTPRSDDHYSLEVIFPSGKSLKKEIGYITSGFNYRDKLIVNDNDIVLKTEILNK